MLAAGELTEGYPAIATAWRFTQERGIRGLPLLQALNAVVWEGAEVAGALAGLRLTACERGESEVFLPAAEVASDSTMARSGRAPTSGEPRGDPDDQPPPTRSRLHHVRARPRAQRRVRSGRPPRSPAAPAAPGAAAAPAPPPPAPPPADSDFSGMRFRWGITPMGGIIALGAVGGGAGGIDARFGAQITKMIGVYAQPALVIGVGTASNETGASRVESSRSTAPGSSRTSPSWTWSTCGRGARDPRRRSRERQLEQQRRHDELGGGLWDVLLDPDPRRRRPREQGAGSGGKGFTIGLDMRNVFTPAGVAVIPMLWRSGTRASEPVPSWNVELPAHRAAWLSRNSSPQQLKGQSPQLRTIQ